MWTWWKFVVIFIPIPGTEWGLMNIPWGKTTITTTTKLFSCFPALSPPYWVLWSVHGAECLSLLLSASEWLLPKGRNLSRVLEFSLPLNLPPCFPLSLCTTPHVLSSSPCPILHIQIIGLNYLMQTNMRWCILTRIRFSCRHQNAQNNNLLSDMEIEVFFFS